MTSHRFTVPDTKQSPISRHLVLTNEKSLHFLGTHQTTPTQGTSLPKNMVDAMSYFALHQYACQEWTSKTLQSNTRPFRIGWLRRSKTGSRKETPGMLQFLFKSLTARTTPQTQSCPFHRSIALTWRSTTTMTDLGLAAAKPSS